MPYDVASVRAHFPALAEGAAHFDGPGGSQTPDVVATGRRRDPDERDLEPWRRHPVGAAGRAGGHRLPRRPGRPARGRPAGHRLRPQRHRPDLRPRPRAGQGLGARRRGRRHPPRPRREHPALGARRRGRRRHGALGRLRPRHGRAVGGCRGRRALRPHPPGRHHRRLEPDRHPHAGLPGRRPGPRGGGAALGRRGARHRPRLGRPRRAARRLLDLLALQVHGAALWRARRRPGAARDPAPRQAAPVDGCRARAVRARHPALRADGGDHRGRRLHREPRRRCGGGDDGAGRPPPRHPGRPWPRPAGASGSSWA